MDCAQTALDLAGHIRQVVRPLAGAVESKRVTGTAASGDATFSIDDAAEEAVVCYVREHGLDVALYTEDAGLRAFGNPRHTLIIDPIDGTRGAIAGLECCVVSVAVADYSPDVRMKNVRAGCVYEIKDDRAFVAERGSGARILEAGKEFAPLTSNVEQLERAAWSAELVGRPANLIAQVLGEAVDVSSVRGGFFVLNSSAYSLTRLVSGQLSAAVDVGGRLAADVPTSREAFCRAGFGTIIGLFPYDFAAAALIADEAGCTVTDAYGRPLNEVRLLDSSQGNIQSMVAACTPGLHARFMDAIERGIARVSTRPGSSLL